MAGEQDSAGKGWRYSKPPKSTARDYRWERCSPPLLFIIFINDLLDEFVEKTLVSAFADDLAIACSRSRKETARDMAQAETDKVPAWSKRWRFKINASKCDTCLFTSSTRERSWRPVIQVGEEEISYLENLTFLGVTYDPQLTFGPRVANVRRKMLSRGAVLGRLSGADWGWLREFMRTVYQATQKSVDKNAALAWTPRISKTSRESLKRLSRQRGKYQEISNPHQPSWCAERGRITNARREV